MVIVRVLVIRLVIIFVDELIGNLDFKMFDEVMSILKFMFKKYS